MEGLFELQGQDAALRRLGGALRTDRVHHALLFEGPDGVGKTTAARRFARSLLCATRLPTGDACGTCPSCTKFDAGTHADFSWTAPEGRTLKVAEIRAGEQRLRLRSMEGGRKLWGLEAAHTMTVEAQNALLKTLEEPPGRSVLVLVTDRPNLLLPTVRSRCQRVPFGPLSTQAISAVLQAEGETPETARWLAACSGGSLGRARSLDPESMLRLRETAAELDRTLDPAAHPSAARCLEWAGELAGDRAELAALLDQLLVWLRDQVLLACSGPQAGTPEGLAHQDQLPGLQELASRRSVQALLRRSEAILEARRQLELPFNLNATLVAEQLCLALAGHGRMIPVEV